MFVCNYCMMEHDDSYFSKEHIVPEKLLNSSHTLDSVCKTINRFMAVSFEREFNVDPFVRDVLFHFSPPKNKTKLLYHGTVTTRRGTTEHRYSQNGEEFLADQPTYKGLNQIPIKTRTRDGKEVTFFLELPFEVVTNAEGSFKLLNKERILEKNKKAILNYLDELWENPNINEAFANFLQTNQVTLNKSPRIEPRVEESTYGGEIIPDVEDKLFPVNIEIYSKTFLKMGWTHCCKTLGRKILDNPVGNWVLKFLTSSIVPINLTELPDFEETLSSGLLANYNWFGEQKHYWPQVYEQSLETLEQSESITSASKDIIFKLLKQRYDRVNDARSVFSLENEPCLCHEFDFSKRENRKHQFLLENHTIGGKSGLCCHIQLFGGIFKAWTQLTNEAVAIPEGAKKFEIYF